MVGHAMVLLGYTDLRIRPLAQLSRHHEGGHSSEIRLVCSCHQVEHQRHVLLEGVGNAYWCLSCGQLAAISRLGALDAAFDLPDVVEILRQSRAVTGAKISPQRSGLFTNHVENAAIAGTAYTPLLDRARFTEQPLEHDTWIDLHRQRCRRGAPAERVGVDAAEPHCAGAHVTGEVVSGELQGREWRLLADLARHDLID